jgi:hypothetical protein
MKKLVLTLSLLTTSAMTQAAVPLDQIDLGAVDCNWGILTMSAVVGLGFDQGGHASRQPTPRAGLGNLGDERLQSACDIVADGLCNNADYCGSLSFCSSCPPEE